MRFLQIAVAVMMLVFPINVASAQPSQNISIVGRWNLDRYEGLTSGMSSTPAWAEFKANGEVEIWDSCQRATSNYEVNRAVLTIGVFRGFKPCKPNSEPLSGLRTVLTQSLQGENAVRISGTTMKVTTSSLETMYFTSTDLTRSASNMPRAGASLGTKPSKSLASFFTEDQRIRVGDVHTPVPDNFYQCMAPQSAGFRKRIQLLRDAGREIDRQMVITIVSKLVEKEYDGGNCFHADDGGLVYFGRLIRVLEGG